jgi:hydroxymethylbilane synthase
LRLVVGTRGSKLALLQTQEVIDLLKKAHEGLTFETKVIRTIGDLRPDEPAHAIPAKGIFEKEIDGAVTEGAVDFAVHSMKDVPADQPLKTAIVAVPPRASPYDVLVSERWRSVNDLPRGAAVGTGSPRRAGQILSIRSDLSIKHIRGNVETRINKLASGEFDALALAEAGLGRLGLESKIAQKFSIREVVPAPGQGALAVVANASNEIVIEALRAVNHEPSFRETVAERTFMNAVGGGCLVPLGALARSRGKTLELHGCLCSSDGKLVLRAKGTGEEPVDLGNLVAKQIRELGGDMLVEQVRGSNRWRNT